MQAVILACSEPEELAQLSSNRTCALLAFKEGTILSSLIERFIDSDVSDIIIVHNDSQMQALHHYVTESRSIWPEHFKVELCDVPNHSSLPECLNKLRNKLTAEYIFITYSTTVVTDLNLRNLFLAMVRKNASMTAVFSSSNVSESKLIKGLPRELILLSTSDIIMAYFAVCDIKKNAVLRKSLATCGQTLLARSDLKDVGFYLISKSALDPLSRMRDEPSHKKKSIWNWINPIAPRIPLLGSSLQNHDETSLEESEITNSYCKEISPSGIVLHEHCDREICLNVEDPLTFAEVNRVALLRSSAPPDETSNKKPTGKDYSLIQSNCQMGDKTSVRGSLICDNCILGANTRIINSVLLSGVAVKDECLIQNCVVGERAVVESSCQLRNCAVAAGQRVPDCTVLEAEHLGFIDPELAVSRA